MAGGARSACASFAESVPQSSQAGDELPPMADRTNKKRRHELADLQNTIEICRNVPRVVVIEPEIDEVSNTLTTEGL
jgi:hypothetical protein